MKIVRSDLGSGYSALPFILYYKIPNIKRELSEQLLKLEVEYKRTRLHQENRKIKFARELSTQNERFLKLENKILRIACTTPDSAALTHKCQYATLIPPADRFAIHRMILRAKKITEKTH